MECMSSTPVRALKSLDELSRTVNRRVFQWLAVAVRPMSLGELAEAIAFEPECPRHADLEMVQNCGDLVIHNEKDNIVQLAHYTVLEFLIFPHSEASVFHLRKLEANLYVGKVCVTYLSFPDFETRISSVLKDPGPPAICVVLTSIQGPIASV